MSKINFEIWNFTLMHAMNMSRYVKRILFINRESWKFDLERNQEPSKLAQKTKIFLYFEICLINFYLFSPVGLHRRNRHADACPRGSHWSGDAKTRNHKHLLFHISWFLRKTGEESHSEELLRLDDVPDWAPALRRVEALPTPDRTDK